MNADEIRRLLTSHQTEVAHWVASDITKAVDLLNQVASGQHDGQQDNLCDTVAAAHDQIMSMLHTSAWNDEAVDPEFWETDMGRVILAVRLWLDCDELITLKEAAMILRGSAEDRDLVWINNQIKRGRLDRYTDPDEPNPQKAGRVSRQQVERLR